MIYINALGLINSLGKDIVAIKSNWLNYTQAKHCLIENNSYLVNGKTTWLGVINQKLPAIPVEFAKFNSRNNKLLLAAYLQIQDKVEAYKQEYGADRIAIIMGTSTSGIEEGYQALLNSSNEQLPSTYYYNQQELGDPAAFLSTITGITGPSYSHSTACSSSARAIISGYRMIELGIVDAVIAGGADTMSTMPLNGFASLEAISVNPCMPFTLDRDGISIGEAAGLVLISKNKSSLKIDGLGESSDAHHMTAPHPEGQGAKNSMLMALKHANLQPKDIGYINLHGTSTPINDEIEAKAIYDIFGNSTLCSSTKHLTGHTLGAAGITELGLSCLILKYNLPIPQQNFSSSPFDQRLKPINVVTTKEYIKEPHILSNSFAFGGNNVSLIIGAQD